MPNKKQTSSTVATQASEVLRNPRSTKEEKAAAASALAQTRPSRKKKGS